MKTKVHHPYIYFFIEPNIVFVFKLETQNYLTLSDVVGGESWETFELNHGETFDLFDHKGSKPLEGRGYFINQEDINEMVEEINKYIQKYRQFHANRGNKVGPVHIVSPEFAAGSLRVGLERPKQVIGFPDFFSIGPLWKLEEKGGQNFRNEWTLLNSMKDM
jgi:hypothetical protein